MELKGTRQIRCARSEVWNALNDPEVLQQCIPGCESFTRSSDSTYNMVVTAVVGPVKAKFNGKLILSDIREEAGYVLAFEGSGGVAGFAKGGAAVSLETIDGATLLTYEATAKVGGKLAQVGARLIDGVAAKMADEFFSRFKATLEKTDGESTAHTETVATAGPGAAPSDPPQPSQEAVAQMRPSNGPEIPAGSVDIRLAWSGQAARSDAHPPSVTVLPVLSVPSVVLLFTVAVVSYLLGRLG